MNVVIIMFLGLSLFVLFLFFYIIKRDKIIEQKFAAIELSLEEINSEIFKLKKESESERIENLEKIINNLVDTIKSIETKNRELREYIKQELNSLEINVKKSNVDMFTNVTKHDERKIINLYNNGYSIEDISKTLGIPTGEISFIINMMKSLNKT